MRRIVAIPSKIVSQLHPDKSAIQYTRSRMFKEGLQAILDTWKPSFSVTEFGLQRPHYGQSINMAESTEAFVDVQDFTTEAKSWQGSADYGAQLFCALLRALGVETRLVCSFQVLPFATVATIAPAINEDEKTIIRVDNRGHHAELDFHPPRHPVFWVEVFDAAYQKWLSIDPMVSGSIGKLQVFEPALNDFENIMSYVIAFEESGVARDVTRRYTKMYIAKTRKVRVEITDNGDRWMNRIMRIFKRTRPMDRDQIEDSQLLQKEISEGMPKRIEDFKGHPIYVLERHLRRDEVLQPRQEAGKVNTGTKNFPKMEPVFRRSNVCIVRSADKWFRLGRQIRIGEQPLKRVKQKRQHQSEEEEEQLIGLYAGYQTELYIPKPVRNGSVPKNHFGNIDIYVASMIPENGIHVKSKHGRQAAQILGINFAEAVTGFKFSGRHGTAVTTGVVVASDYKDAMIAVLHGLAYSRQQEIAEKRRLDGLALWRRFKLGLDIKERVNQYRHEDELSEEEDHQQEYTPVFDNLGDDMMSDLDEEIQVDAPPALKATKIRVPEVKAIVHNERSESPKHHDPLFDMDVETQEVPTTTTDTPKEESLEDIDVDANSISDASEQHSLLDEDPEDEDAEPDWLS
jgi:xeroderma pigmentosum group C-complementing protein